jgi:hypothetical protein
VDLRGAVSAFGGGEVAADLASALPSWEDCEPVRGLKAVCLRNILTVGLLSWFGLANLGVLSGWEE